jgi:curved DNA-binding protein
MAIAFRDYYEILGVPRTAGADEIKTAFRKLARVHHPDVAKDKVAGEAKFKEINEAYEVLGDPEKRKKYDQLGADWEHGPQPTAPRNGGARARGTSPDGFEQYEYSGTGFSDFFEAFFAGAQRDRGGFSGRSSPFDHEGTMAMRGADAEADIMVTLEEALRGAARQISVRREDPDGKQRVDAYNVKIPAGVREGKRIRLAGQGGPGHGGGPAGDLFLRVVLARHPDFEVHGADLQTELPLAPWEAVLGARVNVPTLDGPANLTIKPGTSSGAKMRMRGLGLPTEGGARGDLYAVVVIEIPATINDEERALWQKLAEKSAFRQRE